MVTLGIDIGGTNLNFGLVEDGKVLQTRRVPSFNRAATLEQTMDHLATNISAILRHDVEKIGIGVPSIVDIEKGIVYDTLNIPSWKEVHICDILQKKFGIPVAVNNDANCFAWGVYQSMPEAQRPKSLVVITLGTGIGFGVVIDGKLFCGAHCGAGELCCLPYKDSILEDYCSKKFFSAQGWEPKQAAKAAEAGDPQALDLFEEYGQHLGQLVANVLYAYDPAHIVLAGGIANAYPFFCDSVKDFLQKNFAYPNYFKDLKLTTCTDDAISLIGASLI